MAACIRTVGYGLQAKRGNEMAVDFQSPIFGWSLYTLRMRARAEVIDVQVEAG
jgi:hypothetical protein